MRIKNKEICFYLSYILLYISLFLGDVYDGGTIASAAKIIRMLSYLFIVLYFLNFKSDLKGWIKFGTFLLLTSVYGVLTGDLYWSILVLFIYGARNINHKYILKISISILVSGVCCVLMLCLIGALPDVMTARNSTIANSFNRHSLGFYHSNVLPLIVLYLEAYYIFLEREKIKYSVIISFMFIGFILNVICNSRNAFYLCILLSMLVCFEKSVGFSKKIKEASYVVTKYSVVFMSAFSYAMMFLLLKGGIWNTIDSFFSGRFRLAIFKMRRIGLHFINFMSNKEFVTDFITYVDGKTLASIVLDNGYIYVILRYGILVILFYFAVSFILAKKSKGDMYAICVLLIVFIANFVDNDLVDYSFLPFILFAFDNFQISRNRVSHMKKFKIVWGKR